MPVETADYISDLDQANPLSGDTGQQGDDHMRLTKKVLLQSFPNVDAEVTSSDEELNTLVGNTTLVKDIAADALAAAASKKALDERFWPVLANGVDVNNDIAFSAGFIMDKTGEVAIEATLFVKQKDNAWTAGTDMGGLVAGATLTDTIHCFVVYDPVGQVSEAAYDDNAAGTNVLAGVDAAFTLMRKVGSIPLSGGNIIPFTQDYRDYYRTTNSIDVHEGAAPTSPTLVAAGVPNGVSVEAMVKISFRCQTSGAGSAGTSHAALLTTPGGLAAGKAATVPASNANGVDAADIFVAANNPEYSNQPGSASLLIKTNTSKQFYIDSAFNLNPLSMVDPTLTYSMNTYGWRDALND